mgnify:CR=1 FL=1
MAREFSRAMEQAAKESGVKDVADDLKKVTSPKAMGLDAVKSAADKFEKWDPTRSMTGQQTPASQALAETRAGQRRPAGDIRRLLGIDGSSQ